MRVLGGALPYRDFPFEYPPLAAPVMALPGLAGTDGDAYRIGIAVVAFVVTAVVLLLVRTLALRTGGDGLLARGDRGAAIRGASALGVTLAVVGAVWLALSPDGAIESVRFQLERPLR